MSFFEEQSYKLGYRLGKMLIESSGGETKASEALLSHGVHGEESEGVYNEFIKHKLNANRHASISNSHGVIANEYHRRHQKLRTRAGKRSPEEQERLANYHRMNKAHLQQQAYHAKKRSEYNKSADKVLKKLGDHFLHSSLGGSIGLDGGKSGSKPDKK